MVLLLRNVAPESVLSQVPKSGTWGTRDLWEGNLDRQPRILRSLLSGLRTFPDIPGECRCRGTCRVEKLQAGFHGGPLRGPEGGTRPMAPKNTNATTANTIRRHGVRNGAIRCRRKCSITLSFVFELAARVRLLPIVA